MFEVYRVKPGKVFAVQVTRVNYLEVASVMEAQGAHVTKISYIPPMAPAPRLFSFMNKSTPKVKPFAPFTVSHADWIIRYPDGMFACIPDADFWDNYERDI